MLINTLSVVVLLTLAYVGTSESKAQKCGDLCSRVFCISADRNKCNLKTHTFHPRDGDCYCCDACRCKNQGPNMAGIEKLCDPSKCKARTCVDQKMENCKANQVLVPKDGLCHCCDTCKDIGGPIKLARGDRDPHACDTVRCRPQEAKECKSQQVLVPRDGVNFCCNSCIDLFELVEYDISDLLYQKPSNCEKGSCAKIDRCYAAEKGKCNPKTHIFIPADNDCYCCDACADKRRARCH